MNAREYRAHLYHNRAHPGKEGFSTSSTETSSLYVSVVAFLVVEYLFEFHFSKFPSGLIFPMGFLFFWAFFYTYYRPGQLEKKLSHEGKWDLSGIPDTLMTSCIWFVKIVFVELTEKLISSVVQPNSKKATSHSSRRKVNSRPNQSQSFKYHRTSVHPENRNDAIMLLPKDLSNALHIMGIPKERDWTNIQKRYRELAKKYHPDLNPEVTQTGNRFMMYDAAYRKLELAKSKYFSAKEKIKTN